VVDEAVVNQLLAQRLRAKMAREYDAADQAKQQLSELGVHVLDQAKTWSAGPTAAARAARVRAAAETAHR
jgi:cysteinyl-tRNA synthetase